MFLLFITLFGQFKLEKCFSYLTSSSQNLLLLNVTAFAFKLLFFFNTWTPSCLFLLFFPRFLSFLYTHWWFTSDETSFCLCEIIIFGHVGEDGIKERKNCYSEYHLPRRLKIRRKITLQVEKKTTEKPRKISETIEDDIKAWLLRSFCHIFRNH